MRSRSGATPAIRSRSSRSSRRSRPSRNDRASSIAVEVHVKICSRVGLALVGLALASVAVAAHHSFAMFEMDKDVAYQGVISEWKWQNPHVHFTIDIARAAGVDPQMVGRWDVEGGSINIMSRQGWTRTSYKVGDPIRLVGHPMKDGSKGISLFYAIRPDGTRLYHDIARPKDDVKKTSGVLP